MVYIKITGIIPSRPDLLAELEADLYPLKNDILSQLRLSETCMLPTESGLVPENLALFRYFMTEGKSVTTEELLVLNRWVGLMGFEDDTESLECMNMRDIAISELNISSQLRLCRAYSIQTGEIIRQFINITPFDSLYLYVSKEICWARHNYIEDESRVIRRKFKKIIEKIPNFTFIDARIGSPRW